MSNVLDNVALPIIRIARAMPIVLLDSFVLSFWRATMFSNDARICERRLLTWDEASGIGLLSDSLCRMRGHVLPLSSLVVER